MSSVHDVIGIGFGPANVALAIALEESHRTISAVFVERSTDPQWQPEMLISGSDVQHHPVRDLVSLRNPRSRYSFINFLFEQGRLVEHLNLPAAFPLRAEYAQYITWVRRQLSTDVRYGRQVMSVDLEETDGQRLYTVLLDDGTKLFGRSVVLAPGRTPNVPAAFLDASSERTHHLTRYRSMVTKIGSSTPASFLVVGGSQSAVEIVLDLADRFPESEIHLLTRAWSLRSKDHSPFSEEIYFPEFTAYYHQSDEHGRRRLDAYTRPTNYGAADLDVLERLYMKIYEQKITTGQRVHVHGDAEIERVEDQEAGMRVTWRRRGDQQRGEIDADYAVLATGFLDMGKGERLEPHHALLGSIASHYATNESGALDVTADYRLLPHRDDVPPMYLNGLSESSHGIGDAGSFSLLSLRAETIANSLHSQLLTSPEIRDYARDSEVARA